MRRDIGMILTGILITVVAAWVLDAVPDASTAGTIVTDLWASTAVFIETHLIVITVAGLALAVTLMAIALLCRERLMGAGVADRVALAAMGFLLVVAGAWLIVQDAHLGALTFLTAGAVIVVVAALWVARYLRISAQM